jgi:hypothetical protein
MSLELEYGNIFEALAWARAAGDEALRVAAHRLGRTGKVARLSEAGLAALEEALGEAAAGLRSRPVLGQAPWRGESVYGMVDLDLTRKLAIAAGVADEHRAQREELPQGARERLAAKFATMACVDGRVPPSGRPLQKGTRLYVVPTQVLAYRLDVAPLDDGRTRIAWAGAQAGDESASFVIDARRRDTPVWLRRDGAADAVFAGDMATWSRLVCPGLRDAGSYEERPVGPALPPFEDGDTAAARGWIEGLDAGLRAAAEALLERTPDARWCRLSASQLRVLDELGLGLSDRGAPRRAARALPAALRPGARGRVRRRAPLRAVLRLRRRPAAGRRAARRRARGRHREELAHRRRDERHDPAHPVGAGQPAAQRVERRPAGALQILGAAEPRARVLTRTAS